MSISIIDNEVCLNCRKETCTYIDVVTKNGTIFTSEGTVCPTGILQANPATLQINPFSKKECINCGLCVGYCNKSNLKIDDVNGEFALNYCSSIGMNALVSNYLNKIFPFASNSNRNSSVLFDAYVEFGKEKEAFVEVDEKDALECCRNLMGDFLLYEGQFSREVNVGLIVLMEIPKKGSSNVFNVIEKLHVFPKLETKQIYFTTFSFLRYLFLNPLSNDISFQEIFFNPTIESFEGFSKRISNKIGFDFKM